MKTIGVVTTSRADYGIFLPVLRQLNEDPDLTLRLIVTGMHLSPEFGFTVNQIVSDGFEIADKIEMLMSSDTAEGVAKSVGIGVISFGQLFAKDRPDILMVLGDRYETHAAVVAALPFKIPVAHVHGGELTEGAIDELIRHSITKLSHIHFVSTKEYGDRLVQMGEEPWRVTVSGAPSLDNLKQIELLDSREIESKYGVDLGRPPLLVTYHPVTLEYENTEYQVRELLQALETSKFPLIFTRTNADTGNSEITRLIEEFLSGNSTCWALGDLGTQGYFSLMRHSAAMVGNSSSGIIEAASFELPVVNIGTRQDGRIRGANVIDVGYSKDAILDGIRKVTDSDFKQSLENIVNPYSFGDAATIIVSKLKQINLGDSLLRKQFLDIK